MKFLLSISLLLFILIPKISVSAIMDDASSEATINEDEFLWLEEQQEIETVTDLTDGFPKKTSGFSGGFSILQKPLTALASPTINSASQHIHCSWIFISKTPRYIQFCCLKLDC